MKICVLVSSYDGTGSVFVDVGDEYQDPSLYVKSHSFTQKVLTKENAIDGINDAVSEGYDFIWNFMWGCGESDNVAGIEATKYLESTNHPMLGTSSKFLSITKLDIKRTAKHTQTFKVPKWTTVTNTGEFSISGMKFPLIVKPAYSLGSIHMTTDCVVDNSKQLVEQIKILSNKTSDELIIDEYIVGDEISCMVLETKDGPIALHPIIYNFPGHWNEKEKFLDFERKFVMTEQDVITYKLYDGPKEILQNIKKSSVMAYEALGVYGSGYARLDLRVRDNEVYVLEANHTPAFFSKIGNKYGDDFVIEKTFPGGHEGIVDAIIENKKRLDKIQTFYTGIASTYNKEYTDPEHYPLYSMWNDGIISQHDFNGSVLDLGCGTGLVGQMILKKHPTSEITGIDMCSEMTALAKGYKKIHVGMMENVLAEIPPTSFDHVVGLSSFLCLDTMSFQLVFQRCFNIAKRSITLTVDEIFPEYRDMMKEKENLFVFNHVDYLENFKPQDPTWKLRWSRKDPLWKSPTTYHKMSGITLRFEHC